VSGVAAAVVVWALPYRQQPIALQHKHSCPMHQDVAIMHPFIPVGNWCAGLCQLRFFLGCTMGEVLKSSAYRGAHCWSAVESYCAGLLWLVSQPTLREVSDGLPEDKGFVLVRRPAEAHVRDQWPLYRMACMGPRLPAGAYARTQRLALCDVWDLVLCAVAIATAGATAIQQFIGV
jgi:hypothetical protein